MRVRDAMMTRFRVLAEDEPLSRVVDQLLAGSQQDFPVVAGGRLSGMLMRTDLVQALRSDGPRAVVGGAMRRDCMVAEQDVLLEEAVNRMREKRCPAVPVLHAEHLVGLLTMENVGEFMLVTGALGHSRRGTLADTFATD